MIREEIETLSERIVVGDTPPPQSLDVDYYQNKCEIIIQYSISSHALRSFIRLAEDFDFNSRAKSETVPY